MLQTRQGAQVADAAECPLAGSLRGGSLGSSSQRLPSGRSLPGVSKQRVREVEARCTAASASWAGLGCARLARTAS